MDVAWGKGEIQPYCNEQQVNPPPHFGKEAEAEEEEEAERWGGAPKRPHSPVPSLPVKRRRENPQIPSPPTSLRKRLGLRTTYFQPSKFKRQSKTLKSTTATPSLSAQHHYLLNSSGKPTPQQKPDARDISTILVEG
ncbi:hypothetical protein BJ508DRAFT_328796 [Ascobolus immersus RN42]|uniref:Uncharacterized protein n=1 Tax=Ascobolus immersus RN42 TaxID=1160509 RepID=A0A3N4HZ01_ASCIM|nr:hypothetical protein BJ508DRAFT_328796 [Ascobolus immersus RN42]